MKLLSRRALLTGAAAAILPAAVAIPRRTASERPVGALARPRAPAQVNIFNRARVPLGIDPARFVAAMQRYVDEFLAPVWGVQAKLSWSNGPVQGAMNLVFVDNMDVLGAVAYHDFDAGISTTPYGKIGVILSYMSSYHSLGLTFSHELAEMLVDPGTNLWAARSTAEVKPDMADAALLAVEVADPVEDTWFEIDGTHVSNFVYPAYFEPWADGPLDFLGVLKAPGDLTSGGYQLIREHDTTSQVVNFGDNGARDVCYRLRLRGAWTSRPRMPR